ncbi:hypothetical protein BP5796_05190 [Coleophoma crateriformis]|uniref:Uncharacterized protein n=1 Tax=Coleophoma crateriformis TaxID=565419 RepID=A0A3D8S2H0_9HELO|nr:hypothetical protein BP5796_05190 [Coleophoma crateriformis]
MPSYTPMNVSRRRSKRPSLAGPVILCLTEIYYDTETGATTKTKENYRLSARQVHRHLPELSKQSPQRTIDLDLLVSGSDQCLIAKSIILKAIRDISETIPMADILAQVLNSRILQYGSLFRDEPAKLVEVFSCICEILSFPGRGPAYREAFGYSDDLIEGLWNFLTSSTYQLIASQGFEGFYNILKALFQLCPSPEAGDKVKGVIRSINAGDDDSANEILEHTNHDDSDAFSNLVLSALFS